MWQQEATDDYERQLRWYAKKRKRELEAVLVNLGTYWTALQAGNNPLQINYRFIHPEGKGVVAIDQRGKGKNLAETRLYVYPDTDAQVLYLLTMGDKNSQSANIKQCHQYADELRNQKLGKDESAKKDPDEGETETAL